MSMDLSQFESDTDGEWMEVENPSTGAILTDENGAAVRVKLYGKDSKQYRDASRKQTQRRLKQRSRRNLDAATIESDATEILIACVASWEGIANKGEDLECTPANVRLVLNEYPWLREQVDEFVGDRANFIKG